MYSTALNPTIQRYRPTIDYPLPQTQSLLSMGQTVVHCYSYLPVAASWDRQLQSITAATPRCPVLRSAQRPCHIT